MKAKLIMAITAAVCAVFVLSNEGCTSVSKDEVKTPPGVEQAEKNMIEAQAAYAKEVEIFKQEMVTKIAENEKTIAELKAQRKKDGSSNPDSYTNRIAELEQKNADLKKRIHEYKQDNQEKWQSFKTEFSHDMDDLGTALKNVTVDNVK